jgi:hypothetical protein
MVQIYAICIILLLVNINVVIERQVKGAEYYHKSIRKKPRGFGPLANYCNGSNI